MKFDPGSRLRLIGAGVLVMTFLAGGLAGAAFRQSQLATPVAAETAAGAERRGDRDSRGGRGGRDSDRDGPRRRSSIYDQLTLSAEQDSMIEAIFDRSGREANRIYRQQFLPIFDSLLNNARAEVRQILTPQQEEQLDTLLAERRRRAAEARQNNGPRQNSPQSSGESRSRDGGDRSEEPRKPRP